MIMETWQCDRPGCGEESPQTDPDTPPFGWVRVLCYGTCEEEDMELHYCGWECTMHGTAVALEVHERTEAPG